MTSQDTKDRDHSPFSRSLLVAELGRPDPGPADAAMVKNSRSVTTFVCPSITSSKIEDDIANSLLLSAVMCFELATVVKKLVALLAPQN